MPQNKATFNKKGAGGLEGMDFQLNLMLYVLLQLKKIELTNFKLYTELTTAGKFDDIILIYEDENKIERSCLLQAKHVIVESKTVSVNDLISGDKYNLTKYFDSFKKIIKEKQFKDSLEHLILSTNLNIHDSLLPYIEVVQPQLPIWHCETVRGNEKKTQLYKLNSKFIDEYQYFQLRQLSNVIIDYCVKSNEMKHSNNHFKDCHVLLSEEVFNVKENCFRKKFIEGQDLLRETQTFRDIFEEEIQKRRNNVETPDWLRDKTLKFSKEFGESKSKKLEPWPILLKDDDKESFSKFCSYLILALNQPNDDELEECLTIECGEYFIPPLVKFAKGELKYKIRQCFKANESSLTFKFLDDQIKLIRDIGQELTISNNSRNAIAEYNEIIKFNHLSLESGIEQFLKSKEKRLLQIYTKNLVLSSMKTKCCLSKLDYLFASNCSINDLRKVFLKSKFYDILVWQQLDFNLLVEQLNQFVDDIQASGKKLIVIINESQKVPAAKLEAAENRIQRNSDETQFGHLTEVTRQELLKTNVSFQGCDIEINKILLNDFPLDQVAHDSWCDLLSSGNITIGQKVNLSKEYKTDYYIQRTIIMSSSTTEEEQSLNEKEFIQHALLEDLDTSLERSTDITSNFDSPKIFILSNPAGMGKTTVSSSLATEIKRSHSHFWVARLVAMECVSHLDDFNESNTSDESYNDFITSKLFKLSSPLEIFVFRQYLQNEKSVNKLVVIFDGYDEIDEKYQRVITNLLQYLNRKPNVGFIVITTRPQSQQDLEKLFKQKACILKAFSKDNKTEFLQGYWTSNGKSKNFTKLTEYAQLLVESISGSIAEKESQLTDIPLHMWMIAAIYEKEACCYVENEERGNSLSPISIGLYDLYERFMELIERKFSKEKSNDMGLAHISKTMKSVQQRQNRFARYTILGGSVVSEMQALELETTVYLGIIQQSREGGFYFIHRSFAEFLTAKYLLEAFIENDSVQIVHKIRNGLLIEQMERNSLYVVRKFINCRLQSAKLAEKCKSPEDMTAIQKLLGDECEAIMVASAEEGVHEFLKLTIEVNAWLKPKEIVFHIMNALWAVRDNLKCLTSILDCMTDKWLPFKNNILMKTLDFLIRRIFVNRVDHSFIRSELIICTINFQSKLQSAGMLNEEEMRIILYNVKNDVVKGGKYWNFHTIDYLKYLLSTHRNLFYDYLNDNRSLLHGIMKEGLNSITTEFFLLIKSDIEINADWVFANFIEAKYYGFGNWEDEHLKLYLFILHNSAGQFQLDEKIKFRNYLEYAIQLLYRQFDLARSDLYSSFFMVFAGIISNDVIISKFDKIKIVEELEHCALWGQTKKLEKMLKVEDIEKVAVERFQLVVETDNLAATRRRILNSIRERQGGEKKLLILVGGQNWRNRTILQHALWQKDEVNIELISTWITSKKIFEAIMRMNDGTSYYESEYASFMHFVNERFSKYRLRFLKKNKHKFISNSFGRQEVLRMVENDENMEQTEFLEILKLQMDLLGFKGCTILHYILADDDIDILQKWLNLMKKFAFKSETITQLFRMQNTDKRNPLDYIKEYSNYIRSQTKTEICYGFLKERNLLELKEEIENTEYQSDNGGKCESANESNRLVDGVPVQSKSCCVIQ